MGSFNLICSISGQTIQPDTPSLVLPLLQAVGVSPVTVELSDGSLSQVFPLADSSAFPDMHWNTFGLWVEGEYSGQGGFTFNDSRSNRIRQVAILRYLADHCVITKEGANSVQDTEFNLTAFIAHQAPLVSKAFKSDWFDAKEIPELHAQIHRAWAYVERSARNGRVFVRSPHGAVRSLTFAVIHTAARDALIALTESGTTWDGESLAQFAYFSRALARFKVDKVEALNAINRWTLEADQTQTQHLIESRLHSLTLHLLGVVFKDGQRYFTPTALQGSLASITDWLVGLVSDKELFTLLKPLLDLVYVMWGLERLGRFIAPASYGGQDGRNETGKAFTALISGIERDVSSLIND